MPATIIVLLALGLALIHLFIDRFHFLDTIPRRRWLSIAGGASVAYVFVHILPSLPEWEATFEKLSGPFAYLEHHAYLLALAGLATFYGLERVAQGGRLREGEGSVDEGALHGTAFWLHIFSFAMYAALIGYLLASGERDTMSGLVLFSVAMAFHFMVNDYGLFHLHRRKYNHTARWILAAATLAGAGLGLALEVDASLLAVPFAFLAGGIILNVLKEELPPERESRFWAFALGAGIYAMVLLLAS